MKLNCDLGESYGAWQMGQDAKVMPLIDMANVACGFHAGDTSVMQGTVALAVQHDVKIGAHPSYQDLQGFGRRSIPHSPDEIEALMLYQLGALEGLCRAQGVGLAYVKPHGALNNDMMRDMSTLEAVMTAVRKFDKALPLMLPVTVHHERHKKLADYVGIPLLMEAFADRAYDDDGQLVSRRLPGAVHQSVEKIVAQAVSFAHDGGVRSTSGQWLELPADSLCVHGDTEGALAAIRKIRDALTAPPAMISPVSENALLVTLADTINPKMPTVLSILCERLNAQQWPWLVDLVPSYTTVLVVYDPEQLDFRQATAAVRPFCDYIGDMAVADDHQPLIQLPAYYSEESGPDLGLLAQACRLSVDEVIARHTGTTYQVYAMGFAPGFAFMGELDSAIAHPRKETPRQKVPKGSIGVANRQTAVYPASSPGGWQIIGLCPTILFDRENLSLLSTGNRVRFYSVTRDEFLHLGGEL